MRKEVDDLWFPGATGLTSFPRRLLLVRTISVTSAKTICKLAPGKADLLAAHINAERQVCLASRKLSRDCEKL